MITFPTPWLASHVTRWHSGDSSPWLAHTLDRIAGHQGRMGVLALHFWPDCTRELLVACLCHDLGEYGPGDAPATAKSDPTLKVTLERLEGAMLARLGLSYGLSLDDQARLKFLDRLDAYLWAQLHAPQLMRRADWIGDLHTLWRLAREVGAAAILDKGVRG